jgi:hypothetical protein
MLSYVSNTIAALCGDIAAIYGDRDPGSSTASDGEVITFVLEQLRKMPPFLSRPIWLATALFGVSRFLIEGSLYHKMTPERRRLQVERWQRSQFGPSRDLMKFYISLVVLTLYSRHRNEAENRMADG